ncbi:nucleotide sugar dehydrogenase [Sphingomonas sp.]|uniref:nucleotide sugar dehydrogenase n=1 Tax=Sphingomonas sp. TaxID=28214 RepID=UPI0025FB07A5|nr:nucleotide sugar dehydrogenase [Sphingomonas sp.]
MGLGYVGLPLAVALAERFDVIGLDIDSNRVRELREGHDRTREVTAERLLASRLVYTADEAEARGADIYIVTVPTPVREDNEPDLRPIVSASNTVGRIIDPERPAIVVYESTVYPGVTEDVCGPILESHGLVRGTNFWLGYSPERINPGDREHTVDRIVKVVAGETPEVADALSAIYSAVTSAGVFRAASIKVAEAAKVIENAQRDINIAFMNEITRIFAKLDLSVWDVLEAAQTKWNFLRFQPGLVGGHCIGVDPFYLSHVAQALGHQPHVILAGRNINDGMSGWIVEQLAERHAGSARRALVMGMTFKENVPDIRNSKVIGVVEGLRSKGFDVTVHDPLAYPEEVRHEYQLELDADALDRTYDLVVCAVAHDAYRGIADEALAGLVAEGGLLADLKGVWRDRALPASVQRWSF